MVDQTIDATDVTVDTNSLGLGKPVNWQGIPAGQSDFNPTGPRL